MDETDVLNISWNQLLLREPGSQVRFALAGVGSAYYFGIQRPSGALDLQRTSATGAVAYRVEIHAGKAPEDVRAAANAAGSVAVLARASGQELRLLLVANYGDVLWTRTLATTGAWVGYGMHFDDHVYLTASFSGATTVNRTRYDGDSVVAAITLGGDVLWDHKVEGHTGAVTSAGVGAPVVVAGRAGTGNIFLHVVSRVGARLDQYTSEALAVETVEAAAVLGDAVVVAGTVLLRAPDSAEAEEPHVYQVRFQDDLRSVVPVATIRVSASAARQVDLVATPCAVLLYLAIEDEGSWVFDGTDAVHAFTDQLVRGRPQLQHAAQLAGDGVLVKCGAFSGELYVDKALYETGRRDYIGYNMQFLSARAHAPRAPGASTPKTDTVADVCAADGATCG